MYSLKSKPEEHVVLQVAPGVQHIVVDQQVRQKRPELSDGCVFRSF